MKDDGLDRIRVICGEGATKRWKDKTVRKTKMVERMKERAENGSDEKTERKFGNSEFENAFDEHNN